MAKFQLQKGRAESMMYGQISWHLQVHCMLDHNSKTMLGFSEVNQKWQLLVDTSIVNLLSPGRL